MSIFSSRSDTCFKVSGEMGSMVRKYSIACRQDCFMDSISTMAMSEKDRLSSSRRLLYSQIFMAWSPIRSRLPQIL